MGNMRCPCYGKNFTQRVKISTGVMGTVTMEAEGESYFVEAETKALLDFLIKKAGASNAEKTIPQETIEPVAIPIDGTK